MFDLTRSERFKYHADNLRSVNDALDQVDRVGKNALRRDDAVATLTATRIYAFLLAATAECRLLKVINEERVRETDRDRVMESGEQIKKWVVAADAGFRLQFNVLPPSDLASGLEVTARARRQVLHDAIEKDLRPVIELRNVLAHGQWRYAFTNDLRRLSQDSMQALAVENLGSLHRKRRILSALANCVHDLLVSGPTFDRDFDSHFKEVERQRKRLSKDDFDGYVAFLQRRHQRRHRYAPGGGPAD